MHPVSKIFLLRRTYLLAYTLELDSMEKQKKKLSPYTEKELLLLFCFSMLIRNVVKLQNLPQYCKVISIQLK